MSEIAENYYKSKVYNCQIKMFSKTTFESCYSCIKANIQANWKSVKSVMEELINSLSKYRLSFNKTSLEFAINYLLDKCYFTLSSMFSCQLIKIPSAFYGNLFLYFYEKKLFLQSKKEITCERLECFQIFLVL